MRLSRRAALAAGASSVAAPALVAGAAVAGRRRSVWILGDSITRQVKPVLRRRLDRTVRARVTIDAFDGRQVGELPRLVNTELWRADHDVMVLALGTNTTDWWRQEDFARVVDAVPRHIEIVLPTVYRSRASFGRIRAQRTAHYSEWMRELAASRGNVRVADWREAVLESKGLLLDGVHPSPAGRHVWSDLVGSAVRRSLRG